MVFSPETRFSDLISVEPNFYIHDIYSLRGFLQPHVAIRFHKALGFQLFWPKPVYRAVIMIDSNK